MAAPTASSLRRAIRSSRLKAFSFPDTEEARCSTSSTERDCRTENPTRAREKACGARKLGRVVKPVRLQRIDFAHPTGHEERHCGQHRGRQGEANHHPLQLLRCAGLCRTASPWPRFPGETEQD